MRKSSWILWPLEIDRHDVDIVGNFGANLGEMAQAGFPVPNGFVISSSAYFSFIKENRLTHKIGHILAIAHFERPDSLMQVSGHIKKLILDGRMSEDLIKEIFFAYRKLSGLFGKANVMVKYSVAADDFPLQDIYLNVKGEANLLLKIKEVWASLFEASAILYRHKKHIDHFSMGMAIIVQKMVKAERSGIMFTIDPDTNDKRVMMIDDYKIRKYDFKILEKAGAQNKKELTNRQILALAILGKKLEQHYYFPQVVEWAIEKQKIYIVKRQTFTGIIPESNKTRKLSMPPTHRLKMLIKGDSIHPGIATGRVRLIKSVKEIKTVMTGDVLVTTQTSSDYIPAMKKASVIITDLGGRASHAAIMGRQLGKPTIVGTKNATKVLKHGMVVTVNGKRGEINKGSVGKHMIK